MIVFLVSVLTITLLKVTTESAPVETSDAQLTIVQQSNIYKTDGFDWEYELSDGREVSQSAYKKELDDGTEVLVIEGFYSYMAPDGRIYSVRYLADENGYHADVAVGESEFLRLVPHAYGNLW
ncbi:larval cuticle protein 9-like isoform X2 [Wyeomyia smithii]|uniref:larval cuticle protein 9-like isoform X2 n=1 Tax=Wyeomyia smithii TaxID=174621 RepID=UPI002467BA39|nr:larval cuticle protein 9-like isoform X2 [Wyeomyia smithii]